MFDVIGEAANSLNENVILLSPVVGRSTSTVSRSNTKRPSIEVAINAVDETPHFEYGNTPTQYHIIRQQLNEMMGVQKVESEREVSFQHSSGNKLRLYSERHMPGGVLSIQLNVTRSQYSVVGEFYTMLGFVAHRNVLENQIGFKLQDSDS